MDLRLAVTGLIVLLCAGCASPPPPPVDKSALRFDEGSPYAQLIAGFAADGAANAVNTSLWWTCHDPATGAICPERDPEGPKNAFGVSQRLLGFVLVKQRDSASAPFETMEYRLYRLKPGDYILAEARRVDAGIGGSPTYLTRYVDRDRTSADTKAPRFRVEAGKLYYLGDFRVNFSRNPPSFDHSLDRASAEKFLATYPNVRAPLNPLTLRTEN